MLAAAMSLLAVGDEVTRVNCHINPTICGLSHSEPAGKKNRDNREGGERGWMADLQ